MGGDISLAEGSADIGHGEFAVDVLRVRCSQLLGLSIKEVDIPRDAKACRGILLLIGLFLLEGLNIEVPADSCRDLVSLHLAPDDVRILAGGDNRILLSTDEGRGVGGVGLLAVAFGSVYIDADVAESVYAKDAPTLAELYLFAVVVTLVFSPAIRRTFPLAARETSLLSTVEPLTVRSFSLAVRFACSLALMVLPTYLLYRKTGAAA